MSNHSVRLNDMPVVIGNANLVVDVFFPRPSISFATPVEASDHQLYLMTSLPCRVSKHVSIKLFEQQAKLPQNAKLGCSFRAMPPAVQGALRGRGGVVEASHQRPFGKIWNLGRRTGVHSYEHRHAQGGNRRAAVVEHAYLFFQRHSSDCILDTV